MENEELKSQEMLNVECRILNVEVEYTSFYLAPVFPSTFNILHSIFNILYSVFPF